MIREVVDFADPRWADAIALLDEALVATGLELRADHQLGSLAVSDYRTVDGVMTPSETLKILPVERDRILDYVEWHDDHWVAIARDTHEEVWCGSRLASRVA